MFVARNNEVTAAAGGNRTRHPLDLRAVERKADRDGAYSTHRIQRVRDEWNRTERCVGILSTAWLGDGNAEGVPAADLHECSARRRRHLHRLGHFVGLAESQLPRGVDSPGEAPPRDGAERKAVGHAAGTVRDGLVVKRGDSNGLLEVMSTGEGHSTWIVMTSRLP